MAVPLFDTNTPLAPLRQRITEKVTQVIADGTFILGPEVAAFERELAEYLGVEHVVGVANGSPTVLAGFTLLTRAPIPRRIIPSGSA